MTASTANTIVLELLSLFPTTAPERAPYIAREIERHDERDVRQALQDYIDHAGDRFLEVGRLLAIASRIGKQRMERDSWKQREHFKQMEQGRESTLSKLWKTVDLFIADLSDEDLATLKADVLAGRPDLVAVLLKRDPRKSATLKGLIYERATGKRVAV
jgi:hypothetical protein